MKSSFRKLLTLGALALPLHHAAAQTTVNVGAITVIHGPADLDLNGEMVYAINFSADDTPFLVGRVPFIPDTRPPAGATFVLPNNINQWQTMPYFGDGPDETALAQVFQDMRWAVAADANPARRAVQAHLPVIPGETYKLQILFYENKASVRSWDIGVEGAVSVDQVFSTGESPDGNPPEYDSTAGIVFTQQFTAGDNTLDVIMGQLGGAEPAPAPAGDGNVLWQGLTLERVRPDTDSDGLADAWETANFGNLAKNGAADSDADGLIDAVEMNLGTSPTTPDSDSDGLKDGDEFNTIGTDAKAADTDGDGLTDGAELNTHHTDPQVKDTDLDGLTDGAEVNTHGSDPLKTDSDNDDYPDGTEIANGTSPVNAASFPLLSSFGRPVYGGDAGEGLDLTGTFKYAFAVGRPGAPGDIRGVTFTDDAAPGISVTAPAFVDNWTGVPALGDSQDDMNLAAVLYSIRYGPQVKVVLTGLTPGKPYKLQLLFLERCCQRAGDVYIDGVLKLDDFAPVTFQDGTANPTRGAAAVMGFLATGTSVEILLDGTGVTDPRFNDHSPILSGVTLEELTGADADGDSLDDLWEIANFGNLGQVGAADFDNDGLTNLQEQSLGTDPKTTDFDGDGLTDGAEVNTHHTNPKKADTDDDGLSDPFEIQTTHTLPANSDSDNDGYGDLAEYQQGTNPNSAAAYPLISVTIGSFTGGDPGEGLDLSGNFRYAFNASSDGAAPGPVGEVNFTADSDPGIFVTAVNDALNWATVSYGDTDNDNNLEFVMKGIRWSAFPGVPTIDLTDLTIGKVYKLQLLFAEQTSFRGFDIDVEGVGRVDDFMTWVPQGGVANPARGSVVTIGFVAADDTLNIALDGTRATAPGIMDRNPIINAVTLEEMNTPDTDGDGLPDAWEIQFFGDLTKNGTANPDSDGVTNAAEFLAGTNPALADTDGDGLNDGAEVTAGTNPFFADTDRDRLPDGAEVNIAHTDPLLEDTDGDLFLDGLEVSMGSNPLSNASVPSVTVGAFTGGDSGEGLDLEGDFLYAVKIGTAGVAGDGHAGDAVFTADNVPGITIIAPNQIASWSPPNYGATAADDVLESVMNSIRWANAPTPVRVNLAGLTPGQRYKAQLLFNETGTNRGFDLLVEGSTLVDEFSPGLLQGGTTTQGAVISFEFLAPDSEFNIVLDGAPTGAVDKNPTISGITLEIVGGTVGEPALPSVTSATVGVGGVSFSVQGIAGKVYALDYSPTLAAGSWTEVNDNVVIGAGGTVTVTDNTPAHRTPGKGFWRFRDAAAQPNP